MIDVEAINPWAVLVAGLATFFLGGVWYTALFGKAWVKLHGYSEEKVKEMQARRPPPVFFGGMVVCYLVIASVMAVLVVGLDLRGLYPGMVLGALVWLGPAAGIAMTAHLASDKPFGVYLIDVSFQFIFLVMMGGILGAWR